MSYAVPEHSDALEGSPPALYLPSITAASPREEVSQSYGRLLPLLPQLTLTVFVYVCMSSFYPLVGHLLSWAYSGKYLRPIPGGGTGFSLGGSDTAGQSYNEFSFATKEAPVIVTPHVYPPYPSSPEEDWPVIKYTVKIERSWQVRFAAVEGVAGC